MGLLYVLQKYKVHTIVWTGMVRDGANYKKWQELLAKQKNQGAKIIIAQESKYLKNNNVVLSILHPSENLQDKFIGKEDNDTGVVSRLVYGKKSFLFTADVSSDVEEQMVGEHVTLASDVLKVAHHGSKYSTSEAFLKAVNPRVAIISVGANNTYGHPTAEVLQKISKFGITTFRTDRDGDVVVLSDGNNIQVKINKEASS
jgi:competence protein ComEC